jgi:hypothetical protein
MNASDVILKVGLELGAVGVFTLIAGASNDAGTLTVIFMIGLWLIYMVTDSSVIASFTRAIGNIESQA